VVFQKISTGTFAGEKLRTDHDHFELLRLCNNTVLFHSIRQSPVTGLSKIHEAVHVLELRNVTEVTG